MNRGDPAICTTVVRERWLSRTLDRAARAIIMHTSGVPGRLAGSLHGSHDHLFQGSVVTGFIANRRSFTGADLDGRLAHLLRFQ